MTDLPACSVVICTTSRAEPLRHCLRALKIQSLSPLELVVVQNGGSDTGVRAVAEEFGARHLESSQAGLSIARNQGWLACRGEVVAYLDDDCVPQEKWAEAIARSFLDSSVMAVGGRIVPPEGDDESRELCMKMQGYAWLEEKTLDKSASDWFRRAAFGTMGTGGNMAFRRSLSETWRGFDERLGLPHSSCEDLYAFLTIVDAGHRIVYQPAAVVVHPYVMPSVTALREKARASARSATQYFMFLLCGHRRYRAEMLTFLRGAIVRRMRTKNASVNASPGKVAAISGLWAFLMSRWSRETQEREFRTSL